MRKHSLRAASSNTTAILAVTVLALVGVVAYLVWRSLGPIPPHADLAAVITPDAPNTGTKAVSVPLKIELPKTFAMTVPMEERKRAEKLDADLETLNKLLEKYPDKTQGNSESLPPVPPDAQKKLEEYQKWLEGDRKPPVPPLPLPPVPPPATPPGTDLSPPIASAGPAPDNQSLELAKQLLKVACAAICIYQPELCPLITIIAGLMEIGDGETIYETVRVIEGLQNAANGKPFTLEQKEALKKFLTGKAINIPEGKADTWIKLVETINNLRHPSENTAAQESLKMLDPNQQDPFLSALRVAIDKNELTSEDLNRVLAKLPAADGKYVITSERLTMLHDLLTRFGHEALWDEIKVKLTTGNK